MGISPIPNLTPLSFARSIQADLEPLPMERVESSARTGDETYSPSEGNSARGSEDDVSEGDVFEEDLFEEVGFESDGREDDSGEDGDESRNEEIAESEQVDPSRPISLFA